MEPHRNSQPDKITATPRVTKITIPTSNRFSGLNEEENERNDKKNKTVIKKKKESPIPFTLTGK